MSDPDPRAIATAAIMIVIALAAFDSVTDLIYGRITFEEFVTPGWVDFATSNPELFALVVVVAAAILGGPVIARFLERRTRSGWRGRPRRLSYRLRTGTG
jgi:hypothetical protein